MKIALIGFGKMGREIDSAAREQGEMITRVFEWDRTVTPEALADVDICIEFSTPDAVVQNIRAAVEARRDIVVGTTGWYQHLPEIKAVVKESGLLYSSNFSLGMNIFFRIVRQAAVLMNRSADYDPYVHEIHHRQKADSPSGTALSLARILTENIDRKKETLAKPPDGKINPDTLHVTSTRAGFFPGTHTVGFDSESDLIELRHTAKSRRGFALGALAAARWLRGRKGVYTMDDVDL
ncbi:MAG: 4-hydroxy-tetrahydrodipicolinate reductase [Acidobacteria bacterium]|nr:MAG: 4-hydroxy-tetrahydrodipicolinate reductase [Acidobacteriota bacterium]